MDMICFSTHRYNESLGRASAKSTYAHLVCSNLKNKTKLSTDQYI